MTKGKARNGSAPAGDWLTVPQAAKRLGMARPTVLQRALLGELTFTVFAGDVFIAAESVEKAMGEQAQDTKAA